MRSGYQLLVRDQRIAALSKDAIDEARVVELSLFQEEGVHIPLIMKGGQFHKKTPDILGVQAHPSLWTLHPAREHEKALSSCLTSLK